MRNVPRVSPLPACEVFDIKGYVQTHGEEGRIGCPEWRKVVVDVDGNVINATAATGTGNRRALHARPRRVALERSVRGCGEGSDDDGKRVSFIISECTGDDGGGGATAAAASRGVVRYCAENVNMSSGRMRLGRTRCYRTLAAAVCSAVLQC